MITNLRIELFGALTATVLLNPILSVTQGLGSILPWRHTTQPNYKYATRDPDHLLVFEEGPVAG